MRRKTLKSKNKNLYRIFWLDNGKKIEMQRFSAANRGEAYAELKKYIRVANKEHKYYYEELHEVMVCDEKATSSRRTTPFTSLSPTEIARCGRT